MALVITLIVLGIVLLLIELMLIPGFGVTGILGILSLVGGVVLAYTSHGATVGHITLATTIVASALLLWYALQPKTWKRLTLHENITAQAIETPQQKGLEAGMQGMAITRLAPMGTVKINGVEIEAASHDTIIDPLAKVEIIKIDGTKVIVKTIN